MTGKLAPLTLLLACLVSFGIHSQELKIKKGIIIDSLKIHDSIPETYALFLPKNFELKGKWPLLTVITLKGGAKSKMAKFIKAANRFGYVIAAPNTIQDSLSLSENMLGVKRMMDHLVNLLPLNKSRIYTTGFGDGGRFANLVPIFIKDVEGSLSINAGIANIELLNAKNPFQFVGVVDKKNYNYPILLKDEKVLNGLKFPNSILVGTPSMDDLDRRIFQALSHFELLAMSRGNAIKDSVLIEELYEMDIASINQLISKKEYLLANRAMGETLNAYRTLKNMDSLREQKKTLKRNKDFRVQKREEEAAFFKETLLREDFAYYLEEDVLTYNFNNLGWWNYQKTQINKYMNGTGNAEKEMGHRLNGYVNALIEDNIDLVNSQKVIDEEALVFLYMLKTIIIPKDFENYLKVASIASKNEDFGTSLFYLEEALKKGFKSKERLYTIPNTALLRITPEFNTLVKKYFKDARYEIKDE
ncbi:MAG: alpha/beta hydrolase [Bacteroidota bacterium]